MQQEQSRTEMRQRAKRADAGPGTTLASFADGFTRAINDERLSFGLLFVTQRYANNAKKCVLLNEDSRMGQLYSHPLRCIFLCFNFPSIGTAK